MPSAFPPTASGAVSTVLPSARPPGVRALVGGGSSLGGDHGVVPRAVMRVDVSVALAVDPYWWWCVSGARFYDDGVEVVGRFIPIRDATGGPRPRVVLRSTELGGQLVGFGALGPGSFTSVGANDVLRLRVV